MLHLCEFYPEICPTIEEKARKNLSQGTVCILLNTQTLQNLHTYTRTHKHTSPHKSTPTHTHAYTHTRAPTHYKTHTHTHTQGVRYFIRCTHCQRCERDNEMKPCRRYMWFDKLYGVILLMYDILLC